MGEKNGALFNIIVVVIIAGIIIAAMAIFMPGIMQQITTGSKDLVTSGFTKATTSSGSASDITYTGTGE